LKGTLLSKILKLRFNKQDPHLREEDDLF